MHISWDDIQTIEALVRSGNVVAAARSLSLRHTSVSRRIATIERALGTPLFLRGRRLVPTSLARSIATQANEMSVAAQRVAAVVSADQRMRGERIVITTNDALAPLVLSVLHACQPERKVQLHVTDTETTLEPGVTDLAIRPSGQPSAALRGSRIGKLRVGVYRGHTLAPGTAHWVLPSTTLRARTSMRWLRAVPGSATGVVECDSVLALRDACVAGLGRAVLPSCLAADDSRLVFESWVEGGTPVWVLSSATSRLDSTMHNFARSLTKQLRSRHGIWEP